VYLTVIDEGGPDALVGATTPVAESATLHESSNTGGIDRMRAVPALQVAPGAPLRLAPGGGHLMLSSLRKALRPGETFPLTLIFRSGARVETIVRVESAHSTHAPGMADMPGMSAHP
jgi:copper(I)-binding protein